MFMQVKDPAGFQSRWGHCAAAFHFTPALAEVTVFGGCSSLDDPANNLLANTTVLRLGELVSIASAAPSYPLASFPGFFSQAT